MWRNGQRHSFIHLGVHRHVDRRLGAHEHLVQRQSVAPNRPAEPSASTRVRTVSRLVQRPRMRIASIFLVLAVLSGCAGTSAPATNDPPAAQTATARFTLDITPFLDSNVKGTCDEYAGYLGVKSGAPISLQNIDLHEVATAPLETLPFDEDSGNCVWVAHFKNLRLSSGTYTAFITRWRSNEVAAADLGSKVLDINPDS